MACTHWFTIDAKAALKLLGPMHLTAAAVRAAMTTIMISAKVFDPLRAILHRRMKIAVDRGSLAHSMHMIVISASSWPLV